MAIEQDKTNRELGWQVHEHLKELGIETPMDARLINENNVRYRDSHINALQGLFLSVMKQMGMDLTDDSLSDTPKRVAKMFVNEIFYGLDYGNFPKATTIVNKMKVDEMVLVRDIVLNSTCEHHLLPIIGKAHIAYIPSEKVVGLSKLNRIVDFFARRPQVQERLTMQIHATLCYLMGTDNVAVVVEAEHMCVKTRGVEDACSDTVTSKLSGVFKNDPTARAEFMSLVTAPR